MLVIKFLMLGLVRPFRLFENHKLGVIGFIALALCKISILGLIMGLQPKIEVLNTLP